MTLVCSPPSIGTSMVAATASLSACLSKSAISDDLGHAVEGQWPAFPLPLLICVDDWLGREGDNFRRNPFNPITAGPELSGSGIVQPVALLLFPRPRTRLPQGRPKKRVSKNPFPLPSKASTS